MKIINKNDKSLNQWGNAMVYVLVALALIGFLTITLSRQSDQADGQDLSDEMAELYAQELISYAAAAQNSVDLMLASGSAVDGLDFVNPSSAAFNTPPHYNKVFHPQGGGLNYQEKFNKNIGNFTSSGWYIMRSNVEWTDTIADDVLLTAYDINKNICEQINKVITGTKNIPIITGTTIHSNIFTNGGTELDSTLCSDCVGYHTLCVTNTPETGFSFYSIIAAQ